MIKHKTNFYEKLLLRRILKKSSTPNIKNKYFLKEDILNNIFEKCENKKIYLTYNEIELLLWMYKDYRYKLIKLLESRRPYLKKATPSQENAFMELSDHVRKIGLRIETLRDLIKEDEFICPKCNYMTDDSEIKCCIKCGTKLLNTKDLTNNK